MKLNNIVPKDEFNVIIGGNVKIGCFNKIEKSKVLNNAYVNGSEVFNSQIEYGASVNKSVVTNSSIGKNSSIGVYAHLRPNSKILENVKIGNFVETKNATIGNNTKASHLTYIGDATLGESINVGCGTIFCNYNGKIKQHTVVGDNVFVGSNVNLVAPLSIGKNSFIAAGSTITVDVPENALAIAREKQTNKENYYRG